MSNDCAIGTTAHVHPRKQPSTKPGAGSFSETKPPVRFNYLVVITLLFTDSWLSEPGRRRSIGSREVSGRRAPSLSSGKRIRQIFDIGRIFIAKGWDLC